MFWKDLHGVCRIWAEVLSDARFLSSCCAGGPLEKYTNGGKGKPHKKFFRMLPYAPLPDFLCYLPSLQYTHTYSLSCQLSFVVGISVVLVFL